MSPVRCLYIIICTVGAGLYNSAHAQELTDTSQSVSDSAWYKAGGNSWRVSSQLDSAGNCLEALHWQDGTWLVRTFYPSGRLKEYIPYSDLTAGRRHGVATSWFENGQPHTYQVYLQGMRTGTLLVYYETGALKRKTEYINGSEQLGSCFDPAGQSVAYFPYEQLPLYPGGSLQLTKEITKAVRLPNQLPLNAYLSPLKVEIMLQIGEDGSIQTPQITRSSELAVYDQAVLAAVARLPRRFSPGRRDGEVVACTYYLPVQMQLAMPFQLK